MSAVKAWPSSRSTQEDVWQLILERHVVTVAMVFDEIHLHRITIRNYLNGLTKAGYLSREEIPDEEREKTGRLETIYRYRLVKGGSQAPLLTKEGKEDKRHEARQQVWRAVRIMKRFDLATIWAASGTDERPVTRREVESYLRLLTLSGYLRKKGTGARAEYTLIRNSGPRMPVMRYVVYLWDPNLKKAFEAGKEGE